MFDEVFSDQVFATGKIEDGRVIRSSSPRTKQPLFQDWLVAMVSASGERLPVELLMKMGLATLFRPAHARLGQGARGDRGIRRRARGSQPQRTRP